MDEADQTQTRDEPSPEEGRGDQGTRPVTDPLPAALRRQAGVLAAFVVDEESVRSASASDELTATQGALLAALAGTLREAAAHLELGAVAEAIIEAERGAVLIGSLPAGRAAVVVAGSGANLGMIRVELRRLRRGG